MSEGTSDNDATTDPSEDRTDETPRTRAINDGDPLASVPPTIITDGAKQPEPPGEG